MLIRNGVPHPSDLLTGAIVPRRSAKRAPTIEERRAARVVRSRQEELREVLARLALLRAQHEKQSAHVSTLQARADKRRADAEAAELRASVLTDEIGRAPDAVTAAQEAQRATEAARAARARVQVRDEEIKLARQALAVVELQADELEAQATGIRSLIARERDEAPPAPAAVVTTDERAELARQRAELDRERAELARQRADLAAAETEPARASVETAEEPPARVVERDDD